MSKKKKPILPDELDVGLQFETMEEEALFYEGLVKGAHWVKENSQAKPEFIGQTYVYGKRNKDNTDALFLKEAIDVGNEEINKKVLHYVVWMHKNGLDNFIKMFFKS